MRNEMKSTIARTDRTLRSRLISKSAGGKIAIMSDSHDNIPNVEKALSYIKEQGIDFIIHCGDLAAPSVLSEIIIPNFKGQFHMVHGNVGDPDLLEEMAKKYKGVKVHGTRGEVEVGGKKIGFCHFPEEAKKLAQTGQFDIVFYGHTHRPWAEAIHLKPYTPTPIQLVNPGTLAGMFYKATFAIYDTETDKLELKLLEKLP